MDVEHVNPGARAPHYEKKSKKSNSKVSEKIEKLHAFISYVDTFLCRFWHKKRLCVTYT
jgi:hypothetical protein